MSSYRVTKKRRPSIVTQIDSYDEMYTWRNGEPSAGVRLEMHKAGVTLSGWFDSFVGIESFTVPWEEFDALRAELAPK